MFEGLESAEKDPAKSLHVGDVATPELAPDEAYVAVMASSINFNTVWTSIFEPLPTFGFLDRLGRESEWAARHALPYHVVGSDAAGVVLRVGSEVRNWKPGDRVTVHCNHVDDQDPSSHDDSMLASNQRIWGFETNFGGLADLAVVKANQLMPKPTHLSWEEAAVNALCNSTSYRMLVGRHGARMKQGDVVLVWGATGGIGGYAVQYVLNGGGTPVGVVSSPERAKLLHAAGRGGGDRPRCRGLPLLVGREHPGRVGVAALRQAHPRARRRRPRHRVRAPRAADHGRVDLRLQAGRHGGHVRGDVRVHGRVRQPPLLDEAQAADRQPLRQLRRGLRGQPVDRPGPDPAAALGGPPARPTSGPPPASSTATRPRARSGCSASPPPKGSASTTRRSGRASARTGSPCSAASDTERG